MNQEAIEILKAARYQVGMNTARHLIDQALTKLKAEQPPVGEFTEKIRSFVKLYENEVPRRAEITFLKEACDRLDRVEASKADLLTALQKINKIEDGCRERRIGHNLQTWAIAKAAIAKEKERRN